MTAGTTALVTAVKLCSTSAGAAKRGEVEARPRTLPPLLLLRLLLLLLLVVVVGSAGSGGAKRDTSPFGAL